MLEPSAASQNTRNTGTPKGPQALASGIGEAVFSFGLLTLLKSFHPQRYACSVYLCPRIFTSQMSAPLGSCTSALTHRLAVRQACYDSPQVCDPAGRDVPGSHAGAVGREQAPIRFPHRRTTQ